MGANFKTMVSYNQILDHSKEAVTVEPVTLAEAKTFCGIDFDAYDDLITELITAAREMCEDYTGISFVKREIIAVLNNANGNTYLPYGPIGDISTVVDEDGDEIAAADYKIVGVTWKQIKEPCYSELTVTYEGGYEILPKDLKTALLNAVFYMYDNRSQGVGGLGPIAESKLKRYRRV